MNDNDTKAAGDAYVADTSDPGESGLTLQGYAAIIMGIAAAAVVGLAVAAGKWWF